MITGRDAQQADEELTDARAALLEELDDLFPNMEISTTRLSLVIEAMIDVKIRWQRPPLS